MNTKPLPFFRLVLLVVIFMQVAMTQAQEEYQQQIDNIFEIPAGKIPSGILLDRSPAILDMNGYNSENRQQVDTCSLYEWMCIYYRLYASHLNLEDFQYDKTLAQQYLSNITPKTETVPLGILFYDYDQIKANAIQDGLLSVDTVNMKVRDVSGAGTPTEPASCFAVAPMADTIPAGDYLFHIDPSLFVSNKTTGFDGLYIDFDDNQGYISVSLDETVQVSYSLLGNKTLKAKAVWGRDTLVAYTDLYVIQNENVTPQSPASTNIPVPDVGPYEYNSTGITAVYGIWYRCNHDNTIHKPILIVSGFDPMDNNKIGNEDGEDSDNVYLYNVANKDGFLDRLREMGYDIIIYRSAKSTKSIIPNAWNLVNFITEKVNAVKTSDNELIVIGTSMGGLVSRYALTSMEQPSNTYNHKTKLFISMDSPQNGANVPLGFQYMAYYLDKDLMGAVSKLNDAIEKQLACKAAKQMLLYHYEATVGYTAKCHSERTAYLDSLASIGNFPKQCTTMAISFGSGIGTTQGFSAGANLIKKYPSPFLGTTIGITLETLLLALGIPFPATAVAQNVTWEFEVNAVPNQTSKSIYKETVSLDVCIPRNKIVYTWWMILAGLPPVIIPYLDCSPTLINRNIAVNNTMPLDNAPGSIKKWHNLQDFHIWGGLDELLAVFGVAYTYLEPHPDCFIPAYSALGLNIAPHTNIKNYLNTQTNVQRLSPTSANYHFYRNSNPAVSPFDYLYIESYNADHIYDDNKEGVFSAELLDEMDKMISSSQLSLENKTIPSGQSVAYEAVNVTVSNVIVEPGGNLDITANKISLGPGFHAKLGSTVHLKADNSWMCPAGSIQSVSFSPLSSLVFEEVPETEFRAQHSEEQPTHPMVQAIEDEIRIFPNPVENRLNIRLFNRIEGEIRITVIDTKGQIVHSQSIINNIDNIIDCSQFVSGIYFINIAFSNSVQKTIKIIKK